MAITGVTFGQCGINRDAASTAISAIVAISGRDAFFMMGLIMRS
jgi:hypothetical protein